MPASVVHVFRPRNDGLRSVADGGAGAHTARPTATVGTSAERPLDDVVDGRRWRQRQRQRRFEQRRRRQRPVLVVGGAGARQLRSRGVADENHLVGAGVGSRGAGAASQVIRSRLNHA